MEPEKRSVLRTEPKALDAQRQEKQGTPTKKGAGSAAVKWKKKHGGYEVQKSRNKKGVRDALHHQMLLGA